MLLALLKPLLAPRYPALAQVYTGLNTLQALLEKEHLPSGGWVSVSALPTATREQIDAACGQLRRVWAAEDQQAPGRPQRQRT